MQLSNNKESIVVATFLNLAVLELEISWVPYSSYRLTVRKRLQNGSEYSRIS